MKTQFHDRFAESARDFSRRGLGLSASLSAALIALLACGVLVVRVGAQQQQQTLPPVPVPPPSKQNPNQPKLSVSVELVALHAAVLDKRGGFVDSLPPDAFHVSEDRVEQKLVVARQEDVPVSMGIIVDSSGSMMEKRSRVNAAALTFVKTSNPQDEAFVVNFNDEYYLDTVDDFTSDINQIKDALARFDPRGSTALYDAIIGSADHLKKAHRDKRVLLVITDGEDNASKNTLADTIRIVQHSDAIIYAVGLFGKDEKRSETRKARAALQALADATGGLAYFPEAVDDTEAICTEIARDIRNQYTLAYYPTNSKQDGTFRTLSVTVTPPANINRGKLTVRTRAGYYAKTAPGSAATK
jgi:Ca-activated chloride channel homolog